MLSIGMKRVLLALFGCCTLSVAVPLLNAQTSGRSVQPPLQFNIKDIGALSKEDFVQPQAINRRGEIVGASNHQAFLWTADHISALSFLPSEAASAAYGMNSNGHVVGCANGTAFVWNRNRLVELPSLPSLAASLPSHSSATSKIREHLHSSAYSINDADWIVGSAQTPLHIQHAVLWRNGVILDLGLFGGWQSEADAVNNQGQVVVSAYVEPFTTAFLWEKGKAKKLGNFVAYGMNNRGEVVGGSGKDAVLWSHDKLTILPSLSGKKDIEGTAASAINDSGQVVGVAGLNPHYFEYNEDVPAKTTLSGYAVMWQGTKVFDLNSLIPQNSGWKLEQATGINNEGCIIGTGLFKGNLHAFILNPLH